MSRLRPILLAASAALCLPLSACSAAQPTPVPSAAALVGTWKHDSRAELTLSADGSCTADLLRVENGIVTGRCAWRVGDEGDEAARSDDGHPLVTLDFSSIPHPPVSGATLEVDGTGSERTLFWDDLASDRRYSFER